MTQHLQVDGAPLNTNKFALLAQQQRRFDAPGIRGGIVDLQRLHALYMPQKGRA